ncbi:hypothetical protein C2845_PM05G20210 [Panicum miliaceum]|uniref:DUF4283 domain-containing protein n=1 Tax=Panicum miliaceum TaxID=4540 RepID=A0A3L6T2W4_PANMI|nr:hypothetical protein C2845_PM05G20210 [Panicum miliaceum]
MDEKWDFHVRRRSGTEFTATFPDSQSLETFSKFTGLDLALFSLKVKISKPNVDPAASSVLQSTWIKINGIPNFAKEEDIIKEIASLVA